MPLISSEIDWSAFIEEAAEIESPQGPNHLIAILSTVDNLPSDRQEIWDAHQLDFGVISQYRYVKHPISEQDRSIWLDRLAWFLQALNANNKERSHLVTLLAILHSALALSIDVPIWNRLPKHYFNENILLSMTTLIGGIQSSFDTTGQSLPIWERETAERFVQADKECDWPKIESLWQVFGSNLDHDSYIREAAGCLATTDQGLNRLAVELDKFNLVLPIMCVARYLEPIQLAKTALFANSNRCRFSLIQSLAFSHRNGSFKNETLENLAIVFEEIQKDHLEWIKWMTTFNRYPVRTKSLQSALGMSLVNSDRQNKRAYIGAVELRSSNSENREAVTQCLKTFSSLATLEQRKQLWSLIYEKWKNWDFGINEHNNNLTWMPVTEFDYGVLGHILENMTAEIRKDKLNQIRIEMSQIQHKWYSDITSFNSSWYRVLAKWHLFHYCAKHIVGKQIWELPKRECLPFDPEVDRYFALYLPTK